MIRIYESYGDITLYKFILIFMDKDPDYPDNYNYYLNAYFIVWNYTYNIYTKSTDDRIVDHASVIDNLPFLLRREFRRGKSAWGKTDYYRDSIRFFINDESNLSPEQVTFIRSYVGEK